LIVIKDKLRLCPNNYFQECFAILIEEYRTLRDPAGGVYITLPAGPFGDKNFTRILPIINIDNAFVNFNYCIINNCCEKEDRNFKYYKG